MVRISAMGQDGWVGVRRTPGFWGAHQKQARTPFCWRPVRALGGWGGGWAHGPKPL